jgi:futalosine hydrolase
MNIALVAATPFEIAPVLQQLQQHWTAESDTVFSKSGQRISVLVTGVGLTATAFHLARHLTTQATDWALHAGIAGAIDRSLELGAVVQVVSDGFADLGVEEADGRFTDLFDLGLLETNTPPFIQGFLHNPAGATAGFLPSVRGISVNRVHGTAETIVAMQHKYPQAQVESMEGAAFFYACLQTNTPFTAIRSISNYVEPRNRAAWQIPLAIERLNIVVIEILEMLGNEF